MKYLIALTVSILFAGQAFAEISAAKTAVVTGGEVFQFVVGTEVDCNGSGFQGVILEKVSHDKGAKVKVYKVIPDYSGPVTIVGCVDEPDEYIEEVSQKFRSRQDETVIFMMDENVQILKAE